MLFDEISHNLHQQGHEVRMFLQLGNPVITGIYILTYKKKKKDLVTSFVINKPTVWFLTDFSYAAREDSYKRSTWSLGENYIKEYNDWFLEQQTQFLLER